MTRAKVKKNELRTSILLKSVVSNSQDMKISILQDQQRLPDTRLRLKRKQFLLPIESSPNEENALSEFNSEQELSFRQEEERKVVDKDVDYEIARADAMRDAAIAFEKLDTNSDGNIDLSEAEKLIEQQSNFMGDDFTVSAKTKLDAFFKSFDEDGDRNVSKKEWLRFYGRLFDDIVENNGSSRME